MTLPYLQFLYFVSMLKNASIIFRQLQYCQTTTAGYINENTETAADDSRLPILSSHIAKLIKKATGMHIQNRVITVGRNRYVIWIPSPVFLYNAVIRKDRLHLK